MAKKLTREEILRIVERAEASAAGKTIPPEDAPPTQPEGGIGDLGDDDDRDDGDDGDDGGGGPGLKQADILLELAKAAATLFHTPADDAYADITVNGHRETHRIKSKTFRQWLSRRYYIAVKSAPNNEAMTSAIFILEAMARFDGEQREVHLRVAESGNSIYIDLADNTWRAIEISADGWKLVDTPPVRFRRAPGSLPLPEPVSGGDINALREYLNVSSDSNFILAVSWLLAALRSRGPYPVLVLAGEHGAAKTSFTRVLRDLVDPQAIEPAALSREDRELFISANNRHVLAFDNVSGIATWISDTLCRLATGGGFAVRALYTDDDEKLFTATRPVILNGIEDIVSRPDLADRALFLHLEPIPDDKRKTEKALWPVIRMMSGKPFDFISGSTDHRLMVRTHFP